MGQTVGRKGMDNCTKCTFELRADADICKTSPSSSGGHIMVTSHLSVVLTLILASSKELSEHLDWRSCRGVILNLLHSEIENTCLQAKTLKFFFTIIDKLFTRIPLNVKMSISIEIGYVVRIPLTPNSFYHSFATFYESSGV